MKSYLLFFCLFIFLISCEDEGSDPGNYEYEEKTSQILEVNEQQMFELQNNNGNIRITGSDTATRFYIEIVKRVMSYRSSSNAQDHIGDISISYDTEPDLLKIVADHPSNSDLDYEVEFDIIGPIIFDYRTVLGNGNININSVSRTLEITLGNGNANADVILMNNCGVQIETGNGNIQLTVPAITDAELIATLGNGTITTSGLTFEDQISTNNSLQGILGNGNGNINIFLGNGNIVLNGY